MSSYQSSLLRLLDERGYIHQATDAAGLDALDPLAGFRRRGLQSRGLERGDGSSL